MKIDRQTRQLLNLARKRIREAETPEEALLAFDMELYVPLMVRYREGEKPETD